MEDTKVTVPADEPKKTKGKMVDCIICGNQAPKGETKFLKDLNAFGCLKHHGIDKAP